jgi:hypothetical protein
MIEVEKMETLSVYLQHQMAVLIKKYALTPAKIHGNESRALEGKFNGNNIRLEFYHDWAHLAVTGGEVRNLWKNHTPLGEFGIVEGGSIYKGEDIDSRIGCAIPGNEIMGEKWRISGDAPKSRTQVSPDHYAKMDDPIAYMLDLLPALRSAKDNCPKEVEEAMGLDWDKASKGW